MTLNACSLLYAFCTLVFASGAASLRQGLWTLSGLVLGAVLWLPLSLPLLPIALPPSQAALLLLLALGWLLQQWRVNAALVFSGLCGVLWMQTLQAQGLPGMAAVLLPLVALGCTLSLAARSAAFAAPQLRHEALLLLLPLALVLATVPEIADGWRSAAALQGLDGTAAAATSAGHSGLVVALAAMLTGLVYRRWKSR